MKRIVVIIAILSSTTSFSQNTFPASGNVGIGTTSPIHGLDVHLTAAFRSQIYFTETAYAYEASSNKYLHFRTSGGKGYVGMQTPDDLILQTNGGNVGLGTTNPDAKLTVKGNIHTQEVNVDLLGAVAPDFVFEEDYKLQSLEATEAYIKANKHLPEIPSAKEMEANGLDLKEMNLKLLQKVEELTLHLIEQNEQLKNQSEQIKTLNEEVIQLKSEKE